MNTPAIQQPERLRDLKSGVRDLIMLDPRIIRVEKGHNPRNYNLPENRAHLDELKASIRANGTLQPLAVRWEAETKEAILVDGECRLIANLELIKEGVEIVAVPTFQVKAGNEAERLIIALTANTGKPLSKWEIGTAFQKLVNMGWDAARIATAMGYKERYITESMELSDAPQDIKDLLSQQAVTPSLALGAIRKSGSGASLVLKKAVEEVRIKAKVGKKPPIARRAKKKETAVKVAPSVLKTVRNSLESLAVHRDAKIADPAQHALFALDGKPSGDATKELFTESAPAVKKTVKQAKEIAGAIFEQCFADKTLADFDAFLVSLNNAGVQLSLSAL